MQKNTIFKDCLNLVEEPDSKVNSEFNESPRSEKEPMRNNFRGKVLQIKKEDRLGKLKEESKIDQSDCLGKSKAYNNDRTKDTEVFFNEFVQQISHNLSK